MDDNEKNNEKKDSDPFPIFRNIFLPIGIRCDIQVNNGIDKFLLDYGFNFLPVIGGIFWLIYFIK